MPDRTERPKAQAVLAGIRVVDLSQIATGLYQSTLVGDLGADVIKVEPPECEPLHRN